MIRGLKSPSQGSDDSVDFKKSSAGRKTAGSNYSSMFGRRGSSPILSRRTSSGAGYGLAGLGSAYTIDFYKSTQKSLLQSVIQNIVGSEDEEERQMQRRKLETDLEITSERLEDLVQEHKEKLNGTLSTFDAIDKKVKASQAKVHQVKENLRSCKSLLRCKREELKRLWLEDLKYKHMLRMIENIEEVRGVPDKLIKLKASKHYLKATELLMNSVAKLERELVSVEALMELKQELLQQKETLHEELIDELHRHLYVESSAIECTSSLLAKKSSTLTGTTLSTTSGELVEEVEEGQDPEEDRGRYMGVLVQALSSLGRVNEALEAVKERMEREFLLILERASIQVTCSCDKEVGPTNLRKGRGHARENQPRLLTKMLEICFQRFCHVVTAHTMLLAHLHRVKCMYKATYELYDEAAVWDVIQLVVKDALEMYLACDDDSSLGDLTSYSAFSSIADTHSVFPRRKATTGRVTKKPLFRFNSSKHAISINSYMREQRDIQLVGGGGAEGAKALSAHHFDHDQPSIGQHLVCKPHHRNVTVVFRVVKKFINQLEEALDLPEKPHCSLYYFLHDYVEQSFLERVRYDYFEKMTNCAKPEAGKVIASDQKTLKMTGSKICVLNSVLTVWQLVEELLQLMKDLPMYSANFLEILSDLLTSYKDSLQQLNRVLTTVAVESSAGIRLGGTSGLSQEGVVSSMLTTDKEILKAINMVTGHLAARVQGGEGAVEEESVQDVHCKEAAILMQRLTEPLRKHNIILSHDNLRLLAIIHESLDWFAGCLHEVVCELKSSSHLLHFPEVTDKSGPTHTPALQCDPMQLLDQFISTQKELHSLAESSIVQLHLEVRCHCFYFLLPVLHKPNYVWDQVAVGEDVAVKQLAADLKDIDLVLVAVLTQTKYHYLFEGLGHLVASIFIASTKHIKTINNNGVKKMCRNISVLQSCLSKITLFREKELDRARKYFEMLYLTFDEIMESVQEQGLLYGKEDYERVLTLLTHNDLRGEGLLDKDETARLLQDQLQQLGDIFSPATL